LGTSCASTRDISKGKLRDSLLRRRTSGGPKRNVSNDFHYFGRNWRRVDNFSEWKIFIVLRHKVRRNGREASFDKTARDKEGSARSRRVNMGVDDVLLSRIPLAFYEDRRSRNIYDARPAFTFIDFIQRKPLTGRMGKVANSRTHPAIPLLPFSRYRTGQSKTLIDLIRKPSCRGAEKLSDSHRLYHVQPRRPWEIEIALETKEKRALL